MIRIGTAGWAIPKPYAFDFPAAGTHLHRYAQRLNAVEINSSFYRPHKPATYARWAAGVPSDFRFAVKLPREITHVRKLVGITEPLDRFLSETAALGDRLGPLLVQLPPSLTFDPGTAQTFFDMVRARCGGPVICEPRHPSWFSDTAEAVLLRFQIARAAVDPAPVPQAASPGGWLGMMYYRLHGAPQMYYSDYSANELDATAAALRTGPAEPWCIFDNTALGHATGNALALAGRIGRNRSDPA